MFPEVVIPGEDCLNLNVWTPDPGGTANLGLLDQLAALRWVQDNISGCS